MDIQNIYQKVLSYVECIRDLLTCDEVGVVFSHSDASLCHPLLVEMVAKATITPQILPISSALVRLLPSFYEYFRASCDIALQTGLPWSISSRFSPFSLLLVPLQSPAGVVGIFFCLANRPQAFLAGEYALLTHFLPDISCIVEKYLTHISLEDSSSANYASGYSFPGTSHVLLSSVCHDLRVPLAIIKGYAALLQTYADDDVSGSLMPMPMTHARQQEYLAVIMEQVAHLEVVMEDLLDISRIQTEQVTLSLTRFDLVALCKRVAQMMQSQADQRLPGRYKLCCVYDPVLPDVWADEHRVRRVLFNLLDNAMKYSPQGGLIEIILAPSDDYASSSVSLTIRDYGIGIPASLQSTLFQPFHRLSSTLASAASGVGLGLYISRQLIEAMSGHIFLESKEGQGTSITCSLPCLSLAPVTRSSANSYSHSSSCSGS